MVSIAYGIDGNGRKTYAENAYSGRTYICPYCFEDISVRKCKNGNDYFAHRSIHNRTPQQKLCPGYTGGEGKIDTDSDKICVINGGVPLHLVSRNSEYELVAVFPPLSPSCLNKLTTWNTMVEITNDGQKEIFSAHNLHCYRVKTTNNWIKVNCTNMQSNLDEVKKKWGWGIRGLAFEDDFFTSDFRGGCRVAQHSNIVVGKEYLFVHRYGNISGLDGIIFKKVGQLTLGNIQISKSYEVYSVVVNDATEDAISYIQNKGYQLIEKSDEIVPLWPPAIIEGKELIYPQSTQDAYFYHRKESNQKIFLWDREFTRALDEKDNVLIAATNNKALILSDYEFNILSKEIRYILTQDRNNYELNRNYDVLMTWEDNNGVEIPVENNIPEELKKTGLFLQSNYKTKILILHKGIVEQSSKSKIERLKNNREFFIINEPFGIKYFVPIDEVKLKQIKNHSIINETIKRVYNCRSSFVKVDSSIDRWIKLYEHESKELIKILYQWKLMERMPVMAVKILYEMEMQINGQSKL